MVFFESHMHAICHTGIVLYHAPILLLVIELIMYVKHHVNIPALLLFVFEHGNVVVNCNDCLS